ncbi:hypothetical protein IEQ34_011684 [Dendrobium chrysotoxum]|uniref:Glycosyltransferases n=1 Tax=Dendrobium chrysotoxum TaxID=161865 RepID=A0AAV7GUE2_DENCH|nr:hypothetical protein IEQ34_011684 [Dendrobium chrysotoxum]
MKPSLLQQIHNTRRSNSLRSSSSPQDGGSGAAEAAFRSPAGAFWLLLHALCCLISLILGFRFSRLVFFIIFSSTVTNIYTNSPVFSATTTTTTTTTMTTTTTHTETLTLPLPPPAADILAPNRTRSRVVVGRHGIRIRPWPHPNPAEVMRAHHIMERVQREQRIQYGVKESRPIIVVTPTYVRTFQALHLTGITHSLMLLPYNLTWIVVEAGGVTNETAGILERSRLPFLHIPFLEKIPLRWTDRHRMEARMRLHALRLVKERMLDGIVVFADDSNMHSMELFDEVQKVKWVGALSVGILVHSGNSKPMSDKEPTEEEKQNAPLPIQGPACNSSGHLIGWHTFNSLPYADKSATLVGEVGTVLPMKLEWSGFVLNSRVLWEDVEGKPDWVRNLDDVGKDGEEIESPLALLKDPSFIEPLGNCGKKVLLWWLRAEARADSKFPPGWIIDPPLEIIVPAKRTPWPEIPPVLPHETVSTIQEHTEKQSSRSGRSSRPRRASRSKKKHDPLAQISVASQKQQN